MALLSDAFRHAIKMTPSRSVTAGSRRSFPFVLALLPSALGRDYGIEVRTARCWRLDDPVTGATRLKCARDGCGPSRLRSTLEASHRGGMFPPIRNIPYRGQW
jgi:hypothetical protein